ncbi:restriction endonuclease [Enterobacter sp. EGD-HP1]|uniref:restriction endonuclease n=1 Tax=Enterobacter sp. EGD-HP1 TaxID=1357268 RepID=UPI0004DB4B0F|nr:restriction endonuclease [Enterobacter sp. EGD-HP1]KFA83206.1 restriction endonuclease [Enterobacter sp. EGD-HP1]
MSKTIIDAAIKASTIIGKAASIDELYETIISNNLCVFGAKDPKSVLRITLDRHCINKNLGVMHQKRYYKKIIDGCYELLVSISFTEKNVMEESLQSKADEVESSIRDIYSLASVQRGKVKGEILECLVQLHPDQFEEFCRIFLTKYGFLEMELTSRGRDGGIDVKGALKVGLSYMRVAVQCKKYSPSNKVGRRAISEFRGNITGEFEQGIFITTSSFTKEAAELSFKPSCVPIILIDGQQLSDFMIEKRIGVERELVELYNFEQDLLWV